MSNTAKETAKDSIGYVLFHLEHGRRTNGEVVRLTTGELEDKLRNALAHVSELEDALHYYGDVSNWKGRELPVTRGYIHDVWDPQSLEHGWLRASDALYRDGRYYDGAIVKA